jgi:hypothetical protein
VIFGVVLVVVGILAGLLAAFAQSVSEPDFALPVRGDPVDPEQVREIVATMLDTYGALTQLISASFGAVAFLVAFQQQNRVPIVLRTWALLALGLAFLGGALMLSLLGSEALLVMIERNAVDLGAPALRYGRWATYALLLVAAAFLGLFALDVSASPPGAPAERPSRPGSA